MSAQEEPSYLAFARANIRDAQPSSPAMVRELVARIDRDASGLKAATAATNPSHATAAVEAMDSIETLMDRWFKGQSTPVDVLMQIAKVVGAYEMSKP